MGIKWLWLAGTTTDKSSVFFLATYFRQAHWSSCSWFFAYLLYGVYVFSPIRARVVSVFPIPFSFHVIAFLQKNLRGWEGSDRMGRLISIDWNWRLLNWSFGVKKGPIMSPISTADGQRTEAERGGTSGSPRDGLGLGLLGISFSKQLGGGNAGKAQP